MHETYYGRARRTDVPVQDLTTSVDMTLIFFRKVDRAESHLTAQTKLSPPVYTAFEPALTK